MTDSLEDHGRQLLVVADLCPYCGVLLTYEVDLHIYSRVVGVEYPYGHKDRYDGVSEWRCPDCGTREGRWTGEVLTGDATEPRHGGDRG